MERCQGCLGRDECLRRDVPGPIVIIWLVELLEPALGIILVERLPDGKLSANVSVVHEKDGVKPGDGYLSHVAHRAAEAASLVVHVVVDEL